MRWLLLCTLLVAATSARANFLQSILGQIAGLFETSEQPQYTVIMDHQGYEERVYPAMKWVCTETTGSDNTVMTNLFWRLFHYISNNNDRKEKMAMTIPVTTEFTIVSPTEKKYSMCFFLGQEYQADPPQPSDSRVFIQNRPEMKIFTRRVGGYLTTELDWMEEAGKLAAIIEEDGNTVQLKHMFWAGYDEPIKFWFRRNEVWFPIQN